VAERRERRAVEVHARIQILHLQADVIEHDELLGSSACLAMLPATPERSQPRASEARPFSLKCRRREPQPALVRR
jgi:hypothetical protein